MHFFQQQKWKPTEDLIHGTIVKSFLPLKKFPELLILGDYYTNLYPGDDVYVFEMTSDGKWCRAYLCWIPLPEEYVSNSRSISNKLDDINPKTIIFPSRCAYLDYCETVTTMEFLKFPDSSDLYKVFDKKLESTSLDEIMKTRSKTDDHETRISSKKPARPSFPYFRFQNRGLCKEIASVLGGLSSHIYSMYSAHNFPIFEKITQLYYQLDTMRLFLTYELTTEAEKVMVIRSASWLLINISKFLASKDKKLGLSEQHSSHAYEPHYSNIASHENADPLGFESIFARNIFTGELPSYELGTFSTFVSATMLSALLNNFPSTNYKLLETGLHHAPMNSQCHFLIDIKKFEGEFMEDKNLNGTAQASIYLCSKKKILTEPFTVNLDSHQDGNLSHISAALFYNLRTTTKSQDKVFLAVEIIRETQIFSPDETNNGDMKLTENAVGVPSSLVKYKRGVAAGVVDISRILSSNKNSLVTSTSYPFVVHLRCSVFEKRSKNGEKKYNGGWGSLVSRILADSSDGVAINPKIKSISISVKELKGDTNKAKQLSTRNIAIRNVPSLFYDTKSASGERFYIYIGTVFLCSKRKHAQNITLVVTCENPHVVFKEREGSEPNKTWQFVTVQSGENVGGRIKIVGLEHLSSNEELTVHVYLDGQLQGKSSVNILNDGMLPEYNEPILLKINDFNKKSLAKVEFSTRYIGTKYNVAEPVQKFLLIGGKYDSHILKQCVDFMNDISTLPTIHLVKHLDKIIKKIFEIMEKSSKFKADEKDIEVMQDILFSALLKVIDKLMINEVHFDFIFEDFFNRYENDFESLPQIGPQLIRRILLVFDRRSERPNEFKATCTSTIYLLKMSIITSDSFSMEWGNEIQNWLLQINQVFSTDDFIAEKYVLLKKYFLILELLAESFEPHKIISLCYQLFKGYQEIQGKVFRKSYGILSSKQEKFINNTLSLLKRIISHPKFAKYLFVAGVNDEIRVKFISISIEYILEVYLFQSKQPSHIVSLRLANSVTVTLFESVKDKKVARNIIRLAPLFTRIFIMVRNLCKAADLFKPRRTFSRVFPIEVPYITLPMDSIISAEVIVEVLLEIATILSDIAKLSESQYGPDHSLGDLITECYQDEHFQSVYYLNKITKDDVLKLIRAVKLIFRSEFYPSEKWLGVSALFTRSCTTLLALFKNFLIVSYQPNTKTDISQFDYTIWRDYLKTVFFLINQKSTFVVKLAIIPRKAVYRILGDTLSQLGKIVNDSWDALAEYNYNKSDAMKYGIGYCSPFQLELFSGNGSSLIRAIIISAFHKHVYINSVIVKIIWCIVIILWKKNNSMQDVKELLYPEMFNSYKSNGLFLNESMINRYLKSLRYFAHLPSDDPMYEPLIDLIVETSAFLKVIANSYIIPPEAEFENDRTALKIEMFCFLLNANKPELFHQLINDLFMFFIKKKDYTQAALSLELLANTYAWDPNDSLEQVSYPSLPEQSSFERKEYLYKKAAENFRKGLKLEKALSINKDLIRAYDEINYDLTGLTYVHSQIAKIYADLQTVDRVVPTYFKVSFMGFGFPNSIRNKTFIFEGMPFEHISSMHNRMLRLYRGSSIVKSQDKANELLTNAPLGKFIYMQTVEPKLDISDEYLYNTKKNSLNNKIRMYIENRNLKTFTNSRKISGGSKITEIWMEEYTYVTSTTFPTIMNRSEVQRVFVRKVSPLDNATRLVQLKIQELSSLENMGNKLLKENGDYSSLFTELSRDISGTIDAPINGGISQCKEFFNEKDLDKNKLNELMYAFDELTLVLSRCLILHYKMLPMDELNEYHKALVELFSENFEDEILKNSIDINVLMHI